MVYERAARLRGHGRHAHEVKYRKVLGISTANGTDRAEFSHPVGCVHRSDAVNTRISLSSISGIQFIATSDPFDSLKFHDGILHRESVVSGNSKDVGYSNGLKTRQNVFDYSLRHSVVPLFQSNFVVTWSVIVVVQSMGCAVFPYSASKCNPDSKSNEGVFFAFCWP